MAVGNFDGWRRRIVVPPPLRPRASSHGQRRLFARLYEAAFRDVRRTSPPPPGFDPRDLPGAGGETRRFDLRQVGGALVATAEEAGPGSFVGHIRAAADLKLPFDILVGETGPRPLDFWPGAPPSWTEDWGWDRLRRLGEFRRPGR